MIRPKVETPHVITLLGEYFGAAVNNLEPINTGQMSRVFSFDYEGRGYVARFVTAQTAESIEKDRYIAELLASSAVPVPPIIHSGTVGEVHYAITRRIPGEPLRGEDDWPVVSRLIEMLDAIHKTDVSDTTGYGDLDGQNHGIYPGWRETLLEVNDEDATNPFWGDWTQMFNDTFLDRGFFYEIYERMTALLDFCPEERFLVHGDYAYGNVLQDHDRPRLGGCDARRFPVRRRLAGSGIAGTRPPFPVQEVLPQYRPNHRPLRRTAAVLPVLHQPLLAALICEVVPARSVRLDEATNSLSSGARTSRNVSDLIGQANPRDFPGYVIIWRWSQRVSPEMGNG